MLLKSGLRAAVVLFASAWLACLSTARAGNLTITINTSFDTNDFFSTNPQALTDLQDAASFYEGILDANFATIDATAQSAIDEGSDSWTTDTFNPANPDNSGADIQITNLTVAANTIVVFAGGGTFTGSELGLGGPGGVLTASGVSQTWIDTVIGRNVPAANTNPPTVFAPWGGSIAFSVSPSANWYFGTDIAGITNTQNDFYSVALHELGHVLGIGTAGIIEPNGTIDQAGPWVGQITSGNFTGPNAEALNGGQPVPLSTDLGHWAQSEESDVYDTNTAQQPEMTPQLTTGTRKLVTNLDVAGLEDIGWAVVPEPAVWPLAAGVVAVGLAVGRRKFGNAPSDSTAKADASVN